MSPLAVGQLGMMAHDCLADFEPTDPTAWFERRRLSLHVAREPQRLPGLRVCGAWDPSIGRVTLYGSGAHSDEELVRTLGHELWHVIQHRRGNFYVDESAAEASGAAFMRWLGGGNVAGCAEALRLLADQTCDRVPRARQPF